MLCCYVFFPEVLSSATASTSDCINVFREGSPSRIRMVRRISLGITIRPRSSIRRTIPVAFIYKFLRCLKITAFLPVVVLSVFSVELFMRFRQKMRTTSKNGMLEIHVSLCYNQISLLWEPLKTDKNAMLKLIIAVVVLIIGVYSMPFFVSTVQMWF